MLKIHIPYQGLCWFNHTKRRFHTLSHTHTHTFYSSQINLGIQILTAIVAVFCSQFIKSLHGWISRGHCQNRRWITKTNTGRKGCRKDDFSPLPRITKEAYGLWQTGSVMGYVQLPFFSHPPLHHHPEIKGKNTTHTTNISHAPSIISNDIYQSKEK